MVILANKELQERSEIHVENEREGFFLIRRVGLPRNGNRKRTTAWPMTAADQVRRQSAMLAALSFMTDTLIDDLNWKKNTQAVLAKLGEAADVSRVYVFENSPSNSGRILMSLRYEWVASGIQAQQDSLLFHNLPYEASGFGRWASILSQKRAILDELNLLPGSEQKRLALRCIKSIALAPIFVNKQWWGFLGMDECRSDRRPFDAILDILQITAALLGAAIEKGRFKYAQRQKEAYAWNNNDNPCLSIKEPNKFKDIIGQSQAMQKVYDFILQAAATDAGVILYGESGTGKELVARAIHKSGQRCGNRFMAVNCGAIPEPILESEFFGYKNGAFTGEIRDKPGILDLADGGTLFLDEVGELTVNMQAKLLRAIEGRGYNALGGHDLKKPNFRIIAATNKDLKTLVKEGQMRDDFYFRIHVISIQLPPLRDRKEDIPLLIAHFLEKYSQNGSTPKIFGSALESLIAYRWPGNVRELQNVLHRYVTVGKLEINQPFDMGGATDDLRHQEDRNLPAAVERFERRFIERVLKDTGWNRGQAASALGIYCKTLQRKMKRHGLDKTVQ